MLQKKIDKSHNLLKINIILYFSKRAHDFFSKMLIFSFFGVLMCQIGKIYMGSQC